MNAVGLRVLPSRAVGAFVLDLEPARSDLDLGSEVNSGGALVLFQPCPLTVEY